MQTKKKTPNCRFNHRDMWFINKTECKCKTKLSCRATREKIKSQSRDWWECKLANLKFKFKFILHPLYFLCTITCNLAHLHRVYFSVMQFQFSSQSRRIVQLTLEHVNGISKSAPPIRRKPNGLPSSRVSFTSTTISTLFVFNYFIFNFHTADSLDCTSLLSLFLNDWLIRAFFLLFSLFGLH